MTAGERRRAKTNRGFWWSVLLLPVWLERALTIFAVGLSLVAVVLVQGKADRAEVRATRAELQVTQQREGRRVAIQVLCGGLQAVIDAGRAQLVTTIQPPRFRRNLEQLGLPGAKARRKAAERAAEAYARKIADATEKQAGVEGVVDQSGNLRCDRLVVQARAK